MLSRGPIEKLNTIVFWCEDMEFGQLCGYRGVFIGNCLKVTLE